MTICLSPVCVCVRAGWSSVCVVRKMWGVCVYARARACVRVRVRARMSSWECGVQCVDIL